MRVFLTGATGFIGSHILPELLGAGHTVLGLTRSDAGAQALLAAGAEVHHGNIEDLESLRSGAAQCDGVIHCGFNHDFSKFVQNCENDRLAIEALGAALAGTQRPLLITSGVGLGSSEPGALAREDVMNRHHPNPRVASELAGEVVAAAGGNVSVVRLPQVHDTVKQGLVTYSIALAREKGFVAYLGEGLNRLSAAHVSDTARLYRLALEKQEPGAVYHSVAEEGITARDISEAIGHGLRLPVVSLSAEDAPAYFGWMIAFAGMDLSASSEVTKAKLGWNPTGPGLIADLRAMTY